MSRGGAVVARQAHNLKAVGSIPTPATNLFYPQNNSLIYNQALSKINLLAFLLRFHNPGFKSIEFDGFKNDAGSNSFSMTPRQWIESTNF